MLKIRRQADFWAGVMFLAVGLTALIMALDYSIGTTRAMGPGYFPFALGAILAALGLVQIFGSLSGPIETSTRLAFRPLLIILAASASFGLLLRPAGLLVAVLSVVLISAIASPQSRPAPAIALGLGLAAGSAVVFAYWLGQPLPILGAWFTKG